MSEIKKNIETCRGEDVLAEVSALPQDPHFGSLVNEAFDPMQQQALHQAGYDGYSEVIEQHKPYTFASFIVQMKSNLLLLLRALWQFPFGSGTLRSLADMWQHYITRLSGNETYGIHSRLSSLTDLPPAPLLVADRKISGVPDAADGISLVQLVMGDARLAITTEVIDETRGWTMNKTNSLYDLLNMFPNAAKFVIGAKNYTVRQWPNSSSITRDVEIWMYELEEVLNGDNYPLIGGNDSSGITGGKLHLPDVKTMNQTATARVMLNVSYLYLEGFEYGVYRIGGNAGYTNTRTQYIYLGCKGKKTDLIRAWNYESNSVTTDIELREGACQSVTLQNCDGLTAENMYNHILCRLKQDEAGCGSGVTITLGSTNIAKLEAVEEYNTLLTELEDIYGYTFA